MESKHIGPGDMYVLTDCCGRKVRSKYTIKQTNFLTMQKGMVVCIKHADMPQYLLKQKVVKDIIVSEPEKVRSEPEDNFVVRGGLNNSLD